MTRSKCAACGVVFASVSAFDAHRVGNYERRDPATGRKRRATRRCLSLVELVARGMVQNARSFWSLPGARPMYARSA